MRDDADHAHLTNVLQERRRPNRPECVAPSLIPLLRGQAKPDLIEWELEAGSSDQLSAMRGITYAVLVCMLGLVAMLTAVTRLHL